MTSNRSGAADGSTARVCAISTNEWAVIRRSLKRCVEESIEEEIAFGLLTLVLKGNSLEIRFPENPGQGLRWPPPPTPTVTPLKGVPANAVWMDETETRDPRMRGPDFTPITHCRPVPQDLFENFRKLELEHTMLLMITISETEAVYWWWVKGELNYTVAPPFPL